jgi:hypothetical protein
MWFSFVDVSRGSVGLLDIFLRALYVPRARVVLRSGLSYDTTVLVAIAHDD